MIPNSPIAQWVPSEGLKFATQLLVPILIAVLGFYLTRLLKRIEHNQWRNQRLVEKRIVVYDSLASELNDLLCYYTFVGLWKELTPPQVIAMKRSVDKQIFLAAPLFSEEFFDACMEFTHLCFAPFQGWGNDAKLRTLYVRRQEAFGGKWDPQWADLFEYDPPNPADIQVAYKRIMTAFSNDIGIAPEKNYRLGRCPSNIK